MRELVQDIGKSNVTVEQALSKEPAHAVYQNQKKKVDELQNQIDRADRTGQDGEKSRLISVHVEEHAPS